MRPRKLQDNRWFRANSLWWAALWKKIMMKQSDSKLLWSRNFWPPRIRRFSSKSRRQTSWRRRISIYKTRLWNWKSRHSIWKQKLVNKKKKFMKIVVLDLAQLPRKPERLSLVGIAIANVPKLKTMKSSFRWPCKLKICSADANGQNKDSWWRQWCKPVKTMPSRKKKDWCAWPWQQVVRSMSLTQTAQTLTVWHTSSCSRCRRMRDMWAVGSIKKT